MAINGYLFVLVHFRTPSPLVLISNTVVVSTHKYTIHSHPWKVSIWEGGVQKWTQGRKLVGGESILCWVRSMIHECGVWRGETNKKISTKYGCWMPICGTFSAWRLQVMWGLTVNRLESFIFPFWIFWYMTYYFNHLGPCTKLYFFVFTWKRWSHVFEFKEVASIKFICFNFWCSLY